MRTDPHPHSNPTSPPAVAAGLIAILCLALLAGCTPVRWPYAPGNTTYELGNNFGEYQRYGGASYYHDGLDILGGVTRPLYAVKGGTVTHVTDDGGGLYTGIMIGRPQAGGVGWLYWHIDQGTLAVSEGDVVDTGDYLGDIVFWPNSNFHHVHFSRVNGTGGYPWTWYDATGNPLDWLKPDTDNSAPVILNAGAGGDRFLFVDNDSSNYQDPDDLSGQVDVIAKVRDRYNNGTTWDLAPSALSLEIRRQGNNALVLEKSAHFFHGALGTDATFMPTVYQDDATADSNGDYNNRDFYFIVTNSDNSVGYSAADRPNSWDTTAVSNGKYRVQVKAWDTDGNTDTETMVVTVKN